MDVPVDLTQPMTCPHCGRTNDQHTMAGSHRKPPSDGDVGLCIDCGRPSLYRVVDGVLTQVMPSPAQMTALLADPRIQDLQGRIAVAHLVAADDDD